jgi:hypothetical protein
MESLAELTPTQEQAAANGCNYNREACFRSSCKTYRRAETSRKVVFPEVREGIASLKSPLLYRLSYSLSPRLAPWPARGHIILPIRRVLRSGLKAAYQNR